MKRVLINTPLVLFLAGCATMGPYSAQDTRFGSRVDLGLIEHDPIREASGLVASRTHTNVLWTHNDSGVPAIYAVNTRGEHLGTYILHGCTGIDWEDITIGTGPDQDYLYVGVIGDNRRHRQSRSICRVREPLVNEHQEPVTQDLHEIDVTSFRYNDGSHDAETLMMDPWSGSFYIISKRVKPAGIYRVTSSFNDKKIITLTRTGELPYKYIVAGDISPDGKEILIKTYTTIYYWRRRPRETLEETLQRPPETVPYTWETGGEAVAWSATADGYFTVSEENLGIPARLYFYPRLSGH